ncbi:hypothetical protein [Streptomyces decoyicus]|uniref:hypothetical protein n=1 Tax=Streptomyces decoyicus TaxID=249567 RepID=UPI000AAEAEA4|nr:hypothetical protein K7C20_29560 [Streptomyces decoyicus]
MYLGRRLVDLRRSLRARDAMVAVPLAWIAAVVVIDVLAPPDIHLGPLLSLPPRSPLRSAAPG